MRTLHNTGGRALAPNATRRSQAGVGLVELMLALVLGLLVVGAAVAIFLPTLRTATTTGNLGNVQEASTIAFELMARDIREAGGTACDSRKVLVDIVARGTNPAQEEFATRWPTGIRGVNNSEEFPTPGQQFGGLEGDRAVNTPAFEVMLSLNNESTVRSPMNQSTDPLVTTVTTHPAAGDLALVCDFEVATLFRVSSNTGGQLGHAAPANCSGGFSPVDPCTGGPRPERDWHKYGVDAVIGTPVIVRWYIGWDESGGMALYRSVSKNGVPGPNEQIARGVGLFLAYLVPGTNEYRPVQPAQTIDWTRVTAIAVEISVNNVNSEEELEMGRTFRHVIQLRNRTE